MSSRYWWIAQTFDDIFIFGYCNSREESVCTEGDVITQ